MQKREMLYDKPNNTQLGVLNAKLKHLAEKISAEGNGLSTDFDEETKELLFLVRYAYVVSIPEEILLIENAIKTLSKNGEVRLLSKITRNICLSLSEKNKLREILVDIMKEKNKI